MSSCFDLFLLSFSLFFLLVFGVPEASNTTGLKLAVPGDICNFTLWQKINIQNKTDFEISRSADPNKVGFIDIHEVIEKNVDQLVSFFDDLKVQEDLGLPTNLYCSGHNLECAQNNTCICEQLDLTVVGKDCKPQNNSSNSTSNLIRLIEDETSIYKVCRRGPGAKCEEDDIDTPGCAYWLNCNSTAIHKCGICIEEGTEIIRKNPKPRTLDIKANSMRIPHSSHCWTSVVATTFLYMLAMVIS